MNANDSSMNPFGDWNFVWFTYCDASSFTSNRDMSDPLYYNDTTLYLRGRANFKAYLHELEVMEKFLSTASEVIVSGTSAGGLATLLHGSEVKAAFEPSSAVRVTLLPDAGYFLDHANYTGAYAWRETIQTSIAPSLWNATVDGPAGAACLAAYGATDGGVWRCFFAQYMYPFARAAVDGVWLLQSMYDSAQLNFVFGLTCDLFTSCDANESAAIQAVSARHCSRSRSRIP